MPDVAVGLLQQRPGARSEARTLEGHGIVQRNHGPHFAEGGSAVELRLHAIHHQQVVGTARIDQMVFVAPGAQATGESDAPLPSQETREEFAVGARGQACGRDRRGD